ncbi:MAG TPA: mechanosensitive ion channel protein, partial [Pseudomonas sp.]|nr:mechanosensitive ion channel protein [Pseudomonas sp.]
MSNFTSVLLLFLMLCVGSFNVQAADAPAASTAQTATPADPAPAAEPAKPEILVKGGLLGVISTSIDSVQDRLDLNGHLLDSWRLRADRAADELDTLVNKPLSRSPWSIVGDFLMLSVVWIGSFALLNRIGAFLVSRLSRHRLLVERERV